MGSHGTRGDRNGLILPIDPVAALRGLAVLW